MTKNETIFYSLKTRNEQRLFVLELCKKKKLNNYVRLMKYEKISNSSIEIAFKVSQGIEIQHDKKFTYNNGIEERKF